MSVQRLFSQIPALPRGTGGIFAEADAALSRGHYLLSILTFSVVIDPVVFRNSPFWAG